MNITATMNESSAKVRIPRSSLCNLMKLAIICASLIGCRMYIDAGLFDYQQPIYGETRSPERDFSSGPPARSRRQHQTRNEQGRCLRGVGATVEN